MDDVRELQTTGRVIEAEAFEALYLRNRMAVFRYLRSRSSSDDDAAELTAVTFERALRAYGRFRPVAGGETAWLLRIARNASIDEARRRERHRGSSLAAAKGSSTGLSARALGLEDNLTLRALVEALPERQRDAIRLRFASGLSAREIGEVMGLTEGAAQKRLERGLQTLREAYRGD